MIPPFLIIFREGGAFKGKLQMKYIFKIFLFLFFISGKLFSTQNIEEIDSLYLTNVLQKIEKSLEKKDEESWKVLKSLSLEISRAKETTEKYIAHIEKDCSSNMGQIKNIGTDLEKNNQEIQRLIKNINNSQAETDRLKGEIESLSSDTQNLKKTIEEAEAHQTGETVKTVIFGIVSPISLIWTIPQLNEKKEELERKRRALSKREAEIKRAQEEKASLVSQKTRLEADKNLRDLKKFFYEEQTDILKNWQIVLRKGLDFWNLIDITLNSEINPSIESLSHIYKKIEHNFLEKVETKNSTISRIERKQRSLMEELYDFCHLISRKESAEGDWIDYKTPHVDWKTNKSITLETFKGSLYLFHLSYNSDQFYQSLLEKNGQWSPAEEVKVSFRTKDPLSLKAYRDTFFMACRSLHSREIYLSSSTDGRHWNETCHQWRTSYAPILEVFHDKLFLGFCEGEEGEASLYVSSSMDGKSWSRKKEIHKYWVTNQPFSLKTFKEKLYVAHNSFNSDDIWLSSSKDGVNWEEAYNPGQSWKTKSPVTMEVFNDKLFIGHVSIDGQFILSCSKNGIDWSEVSIGNSIFEVSEPFSLKSYQGSLYMGQVSKNSRAIWMSHIN